MNEPQLAEVQRLVDQLPLTDQARLLAYLAPKVAQSVASLQDQRLSTPTSDSTAWDEFFRIGDAILASDIPDSETLTEAVRKMRR